MTLLPPRGAAWQPGKPGLRAWLGEAASLRLPRLLT